MKWEYSPKFNGDSIELERNVIVVLCGIEWRPEKCLHNEIAGRGADQSTARTECDCDAMRIDTLRDYLDQYDSLFWINPFNFSLHANPVLTAFALTFDY